MDQGIYYDASVLKLLTEFASTLQLTKSTKSGQSEPFVVLPYALKFFSNLLGWKRADGSRLYRKAYWSMARKNAKTQYLALLALFLLLFDREAKPEIYIAATEVDQAGECYTAARDMVLSNPELEAIIHVIDYKRTLICKTNGGLLRALSSKGKTKHGKNPSAVIFDELHVWGPEHQALYDALTTGSTARRQPLHISITTAGHEEESICHREYTYAKRVMSGILKDTTYYAEIHELPKEADWTDESLWHLSNPGIDTIVSRQMLREERDRALNMPSKQNAFRQLYCNQWTQTADVWIPLHVWDKNDGEVNLDQLRNVPCYGGLDLAAKNDLTAFVLWWEYEDRFYVKPWFFIPTFDTAGANIHERGQKCGVDYGAWKKAGILEVTEGNETDWKYVCGFIEKLDNEYDIRAVAYDRWGARDVARNLTDGGIEVIPWGQGYVSMSPPTLRFESLVTAGRVNHAGNPILRWNVECTTVTSDPAGLVKPVKPQVLRKNRRIDGIVASIMACGAYMEADGGFADVGVSSVAA